jgi:hypothetical protein
MLIISSGYSYILWQNHGQGGGGKNHRTQKNKEKKRAKQVVNFPNVINKV